MLNVIEIKFQKNDVARVKVRYEAKCELVALVSKVGRSQT